MINSSASATIPQRANVPPANAIHRARLVQRLLTSADMSDPQPPADADEPTSLIIARIRAGDATARERLIRKYLPILRRWAHGRMPMRARDISDTDDLVQIALMKAVERIGNIRETRPGAFLSYLRSVLLNHVRDELRRVGSRPQNIELDDALPDLGPSLVEEMIGIDRLRAYERATARLPQRQQELIILRVEFGMTYHEIAAEVEGTPDAVRVMLARALSDIARYMDDETGS